jgi:hypothetical protein
VTERLQLECPHCGSTKTVDVNAAIPLQRFDLRCCGGQVVTARIMAVRPEFTVREVTWERSAYHK